METFFSVFFLWKNRNLGITLQKACISSADMTQPIQWHRQCPPPVVQGCKPRVLTDVVHRGTVAGDRGHPWSAFRCRAQRGRPSGGRDGVPRHCWRPGGHGARWWWGGWPTRHVESWGRFSRGRETLEGRTGGRRSVGLGGRGPKRRPSPRRRPGEGWREGASSGDGRLGCGAAEADPARESEGAASWTWSWCFCQSCVMPPVAHALRRASVRCPARRGQARSWGSRRAVSQSRPELTAFLDVGLVKQESLAEGSTWSARQATGEQVEVMVMLARSCFSLGHSQRICICEQRGCPRIEGRM